MAQWTGKQIFMEESQVSSLAPQGSKALCPESTPELQNVAPIENIEKLLPFKKLQSNQACETPENKNLTLHIHFSEFIPLNKSKVSQDNYHS